MIPQHLKDSFDRYVSHGILPGGFLTAVLENNLTEAVGRADTHNLANIRGIVAYAYNEIPADCWGSPEKIDVWINRFHKTNEEEQ